MSMPRTYTGLTLMLPKDLEINDWDLIESMWPDSPPRTFGSIDNFWKCEHSGYRKFRGQCSICDGLDAALGF